MTRLCFCSPPSCRATRHDRNVLVKNHTALARLNHWRAHHKRLAELIVYTAISLGVVVSIVVAARAGVSENLILKTYLFILIIPIAFRKVISENRRYPRRSAFWALTLTLLFIHVAVWLFLLSRTNEAPSGRSVLVAAFVAAFIEPAILRFLLNSFLHRARPHYFPA